MSQEGFLVLESGEVFSGELLNGLESVGEVVFNTSHSGYEEMSTDPSYFQQIIVATAPMQGNYGIGSEFCESDEVSIKGFLSLEMQRTQRDSSWLKRLTENKVPVLTELDTRKLVKVLRAQGSVWGGVFKSSCVKTAQDEIAKRKSEFAPLDWTALVSVKEPTRVEGKKPSGPKVGLLDFGYKKNILRELVKRSSEVWVLPSRTSADEMLSMNLDGVLLSNGPGDPALVEGPVQQIQSLLGKLPIMGICMGHQLLGRALGLKTFKLKFGHRGANHPIQDIQKDFIYMSSQNHGYALMEDTSLGEDVEVTHYNLNDKTVAGIRSISKNCFSVQFHPESCPGPSEAQYLFDDFITSIHQFQTMPSAQGVRDGL